MPLIYGIYRIHLFLSRMQKFLIIQTAFLGDVILATPVANALREKYPDAQIDLLVRKGNESLVQGHYSLDNVLIWNKQEGKYKSLRALKKRIVQEKYTEIINLHRFASSGFLTAFGKAESSVGFDKNPLSFLFKRKVKHDLTKNLHEVERNLSLIAHHGVPKKLRPTLHPAEKDFAFVNQYKGQKYVCFAPASVWFTKQMPKEKWIELGHTLNHKIYLIGGPGDLALCEEIAQELDNAEVLAGKLNLMQSAALIKDAQHCYVNDSGPMHISSAMNTPTTAFYCSTVPEFGFGPLAEQSRIISKSMDCKPCGLHGHKACPKGHFDCGYKIDFKNDVYLDS